MNKKIWVKPVVNTLDVQKTEYGNNITEKVDATYQDGHSTYYSFS